MACLPVPAGQQARQQCQPLSCPGRSFPTVPARTYYEWRRISERSWPPASQWLISLILLQHVYFNRQSLGSTLGFQQWERAWILAFFTVSVCSPRHGTPAFCFLPVRQDSVCICIHRGPGSIYVCACCLWIQVQGVGTCLSIVGTALHSTTSSCVTVTKVPQVLLLLVNSTPSTELELAAVSNSKRGSPSTSRSFLSSQSKQRRLTPTNKQLDRSQQSCMTWDTIL